ncbi:unnamed protein product [Ixodes pacificus]
MLQSLKIKLTSVMLASIICNQTSNQIWRAHMLRFITPTFLDNFSHCCWFFSAIFLAAILRTGARPVYSTQSLLFQTSQELAALNCVKIAEMRIHRHSLLYHC